MNRAPVTALVAGGHVGRFGRHLETSLGELARPVVAAALAQAGLDRAQIQAAFVGNAFGGALQNQESILGQTLLTPCAIAGIPIHTVKNACSSGADAVHLAWAAVAYGQYDCVLALGAEKLNHPEKARAFAALASATDHPPQGEGRSVFMDINAERAKAYMARHGATPRHFALVAAKNRRHAALNPNAALREPATAEAILADKTVVAPLTRGMCGGLSDGAAALVIVSEAYARRYGIAAPRIVASAVVSGMAEGPNATARAGAEAFRQAGIEPRDVSLAEVHDATSPQEMFDLEDLGFAPPGGAVALVETGATSLGGALPVNVSGGLVARGHPVGATGVAQLVEIAQQLRGKAGPSQVEGAKIGLAQMAGGLLGRDSAVAAVHLLTV
ncbi:MAG: thiolase family protein [Rhodospirillaceae bacterium]|nr:thiolase family protein [Rhodospirillaceae bacterium]